MVYDGDRLAGSGGDLVILTFEIDGLVVVDPTCMAQGEVQIQET